MMKIRPKPIEETTAIEATTPMNLLSAKEFRMDAPPGKIVKLGSNHGGCPYCKTCLY